MESPTPEFLYRYRHLHGEHREWTANILRRSVLFFASPVSFDDPLDCKVHFQLASSEAELRRKHRTLLRKFAPELNRPQRRARAASDLRDFDRQRFLTAITAGLQSEVDRAGVVCLSQAPDNLLLWSYYAAGHTGLCLAFSVASDAAFFGRAQAVTYSAECAKIDLLGDSPEKQVDVFLLTKAAEWKHQGEWRILDHETGAGEKAFAPHALVGVILGARMSKPDRSFVVDCLRDRSPPVHLFQARIHPGRYGVSIERAEP